MAGVMAAQRLPPGAEVVSQGAASDALFFLRSGAARAVRNRIWGIQHCMPFACGDMNTLRPAQPRTCK